MTLCVSVSVSVSVSIMGNGFFLYLNCRVCRCWPALLRMLDRKDSSYKS